MLRGANLGLVISFAFYSATGFHDPISFVDGALYGAKLKVWLTRSKK